MQKHITKDYPYSCKFLGKLFPHVVFVVVLLNTTISAFTGFSSRIQSADIWAASAGEYTYFNLKSTYEKPHIGENNRYGFNFNLSFPLENILTLGIESSLDVDRFFTMHSWNIWIGKTLFHNLNLAVSPQFEGYLFDPHEALTEMESDPLIKKTNRLEFTFSAGIAAKLGKHLVMAAEARNLLPYNLSSGPTNKNMSSIEIAGSAEIYFKSATPYIDLDISIEDPLEYSIIAGLEAHIIPNILALDIGAGNSMIRASIYYAFDNLIAGYSAQHLIDSEVADWRHGVSIEINNKDEKRETVTSEECLTNTLPLEWIHISKAKGISPYYISIASVNFDSMFLHVSPSQNLKLKRVNKKGLWMCELEDFPGSNIWISAFDDEKQMCLKSIYNNMTSAVRMTIMMDAYEIFIPKSPIALPLTAIDSIVLNHTPLFIDSKNQSYWKSYLDNPASNRFLFAAPGYKPEPPRIELSSEFVVEKVDNRVHAVVEVSYIPMPHRIIATSEWAGDCAVQSSNKSDTLTFIIPNSIPKQIPLVVTGSATDPWFRVHHIGPDTLDNELIDKIWENTDYSMFNFIYNAQDDRYCRNTEDTKLDDLVQKTREAKGKLLITGDNYINALCAYNHARLSLPASQVRIDPALVSGDRPFTSEWQTPDSLWFINNFTQAIVEWEPLIQPDDIAGYLAFVSDKPISEASNLREIIHLKVNSEPISSNSFIVTNIEPNKNYYIRLAPITGDGRLGELSHQLIIGTKPRRKTEIHEFMSKLGNPSAFDFSEYTEISMLYKNASLIDLYLGTNSPGDSYGSLMLKSPSKVQSKYHIWETRNAGILFMDFLELDAIFDVQELTTFPKTQEEPCRISARYLVRTPDGYELIIKVENIVGGFPNRRVEIQYLYRLVENAPLFKVK
ncbi:fibronectin type III domain-containing protein [bacterium]|nr:fibronectin type III domain-containing protein [bacterium]